MRKTTLAIVFMFGCLLFGIITVKTGDMTNGIVMIIIAAISLPILALIAYISSPSDTQSSKSTNSQTQNISQNIPKCPTCGSVNVEKISTMNRVVSAHLLGLASDNIGKTMYCRNCGYKW